MYVHKMYFVYICISMFNGWFIFLTIRSFFLAGVINHEWELLFQYCQLCRFYCTIENSFRSENNNNNNVVNYYQQYFEAISKIAQVFTQGQE